MILSDIATKARSLVNADTSAYPNASLLIDLNITQQKIVNSILEAQDEADYDDGRIGDYPTGTIPLTTNRDYAISSTEKMLKIKNLSISYDGVIYYPATPIDSSEVSGISGPASATANETLIDSNFSKTEPRYDIKYGSIFIYPKPSQADVDASGKIYLEWSRQSQDFTSDELTTGTAIPGFDDIFHPMLSYGCALEYAIAKSKDNVVALEKKYMEYDARLRQHYSNKQRDRKYHLVPAYTSYK